MAVSAIFFWLLGFVLSVLIAPVGETWTWGFPMCSLAVACLFSIPLFLRNQLVKEGFIILIPALLLVGWMVLRIYTSPVKELAIQDLLLLCMAISTYLVFRAITGSQYAEKGMIFGASGLLAASLYVMFQQWYDPSYSPILPAGEVKFLRGFHHHYSYCASFLIPTSLIVTSFAFFGRIHGFLRFLFLLLGIAGLIAVVFTKSRGGVIAMGVGVSILFLGGILWGRKKEKKWFLPVALITPFVAIGGVILFYSLLINVEQTRSLNSNFSGLLDNHIRLYLLSAAITCIFTHPWWGGGSRSFSWESFHAWDPSAYGTLVLKPGHVHNELVQTVSEYGIIGGILLIILLFSIITVSIVSISIRSKEGEKLSEDAWRIGGIAGLFGLLAHSLFEGIFRIPPGAILLGLCLSTAAAYLSKDRDHKLSRTLMNGILALCALSCAIPLAFYGVKSASASIALLPAYYVKKPLNEQIRLEALTEGLKHWPSGQLYHLRGSIYRSRANSSHELNEKAELNQLAFEDFSHAADTEPTDPNHWINQGQTLTSLNRYDEALVTYKKAVEIQGKMEAAFHGNHHYAEGLLNKASSVTNEADDLSELTAYLKQALYQIDLAYEQGNGFQLGARSYELRENILVAYASALESSGKLSEALQHYDLASTINYRGHGAFYAARMLAGHALKCLFEQKNQDSLRFYLEADKRISQAKLSGDITEERKTQLHEYLKATIQSLQSQNIQASETLNF